MKTLKEKIIEILGGDESNGIADQILELVEFEIKKDRGRQGVEWYKLFAKLRKKWVNQLKQGKICHNCGAEKENDLCNWCGKCMENE